MAVKTFTTGEVLTAADTNTYLNNGGLVYITQASATSGSTLSISNCFTSTYANYRLLAYNVTTNGSAAMPFQLVKSGTAAATNYNLQRLYVQGATVGGASGTGGTSWNFAYQYPSTAQFIVMDLFNPQVTGATNMMLWQNYRDNANVPYIEQRFGYHSTSDSYDGFRVTTTDTYTASTIIVYGYRQA